MKFEIGVDKTYKNGRGYNVAIDEVDFDAPTVYSFSGWSSGRQLFYDKNGRALSNWEHSDSIVPWSEVTP